MRVLHVTEYFFAGGLEKFLLTLNAGLKKRGWDSYYAIGRYTKDSQSLLQGQQANYGFGFGDSISQSVKSFTDDVRLLCDIIQLENVDYIIVHPFYSVFPAVAAAKITGVPIAYVVHGPGSITFPESQNANALFQYCLDECLDHIFVVREGLVRTTRDVAGSVSLLRNPVDVREVRRSVRADYRNWALVSRLDSDKYPSIMALLELMPELEIDKLDIYGSGSKESAIEQDLSQLNLSERVRIHGFHPDWIKEAVKHDIGVIGIGRVAIEALCAGMPTMLLSFDSGPCGIIDSNMLAQSLNDNFSSRTIARIEDANNLNMQLKKVYESPDAFDHSEYMNQYFGVEAVVDSFINALESAKAIPDTRWISFVSELDHLEDVEMPLFSSGEVAELIWRIFGFWSVSANSHQAMLEAYEHERMRQDYNIKVNNLYGLYRAELEEMRGIEEARLDGIQLELDKALEKQAEQEKLIDSLLSSKSWRIGRAITALPRFIKRTLGK